MADNWSWVSAAQGAEEDFFRVFLHGKSEMDILFLDDNENRTVAFLEAHPNATTVATAKECIARLEKHSYDLVCLDHDLGGRIDVDPNEPDTGMEVVRWIVDNPVQVNQFIVHSFNPYAADSMTNSLRQANFHVMQIPFGSRSFWEAVAAGR